MSVEIPLDDINVDLTLYGGGTYNIGLGSIATALTTGINADVGLNDIKADVGLGDIKADVGLGDIKADVDVGLDNIKATADVDVGLDDIRIKEIPLIRSDSKLDLGLDNIRITELPTIRFELSMRPIRVHLPLNYSFCLELFGVRLFKFSVCGEGMVITEDYKAHETERCG